MLPVHGALALSQRIHTESMVWTLLEISLLGTFALPVLPLATRLPLLHAAVQCGVFKGLKEGSLPSCYSDVMAMCPQCENQFLPRASCPVLFFSSRVSCIVLSFKCHSGKGAVSSCNLWRAAGW